MQHTIVLLLFWNLSGITWVSRYQRGKTKEGKTNLDLLEQEIVSGSGICWAICKSAVCTSSQITTPTSHHSVFYRPDALPATQPTGLKPSTQVIKQTNKEMIDSNVKHLPLLSFPYKFLYFSYSSSQAFSLLSCT